MPESTLASILEGFQSQPHQLVEVLQDVQKKFGYISEDAMRAISFELGVPLLEVYRVASFYKGFTVETDQTENGGGDNSAPEPYDLFLSSLSTCAGVYMVYFCEKRNIPTDGMKMTVRAEKNEKTKLFESILR